jgi:thiol-disulfide isomerase/thioredoxin
MNTRKPPGAGGSAAPPRRFPLLPIVFVVVAGLLVAAVLLTGGNDEFDPDPDAPDEFGAPTVTGEPLPAFPNPAPTSPVSDPAFGASIPAVTGADFAGNPVEIAADGTAKGIVFLAHWCSHCQAEVPRVTEWLAETGGVPGTEIVAVATAMDRTQNNYPPSSWLAREEWPAPTLTDDASGSVHQAFGGGGFPYWVFVDSQGRVVARTAGELDVATLQTLLTAAAAG